MTDATAKQYNSVWYPSAAVVAKANVTKLAAELRCETYAQLHKLSIEKPDAYWAHLMDFLHIRWSRPYDVYCDLSLGKPFPSWFVGGELNWVDTIFAWASENGDRACVIAEQEDGTVSQLSYRDMETRVKGFAAGLREEGICRGERIGLLIENGIEAVVSFLGISCLGAIAVPLFSGFGRDAVVSRLSLCGAVGLIATSGFYRRGKRVDVLSLVQDVSRDLPELRTIIVKGAKALPQGCRDWATVHGDRTDGLSARMRADDPMMAIFTSGTTGKPKGAVHTHGGFPLKIAHDAAVHFDIGPGDVFCWPADMGWIAGPLVLASALMRGATLVCYDGAPDYPDKSRMSRLIERHRVTHFGSSPTLIRGLAGNERESLAGDRSTLRLLVTAGERIDPEHFIWFAKVFGEDRCPLINYTGGTEVSGAILSNVPTLPIVPSGFNSASPCLQVDVLDDDGTTVRGAIGELAILAPFVGMTHGFWNDRDRYLETYWSQFEGVWIHGDLAMRDDAGVFFILGRSDDTLKIAGKRVGPSEVEEILLDVPTIAETAAIGVDDALKGQQLIVFVVPRDSSVAVDMLERDVADRIANRLGKPFRPARVHVVAQLPKTRSLKIMRRVIRNLYTNQPVGDLSSLDNPAALECILAAAGIGDQSDLG